MPISQWRRGVTFFEITVVFIVVAVLAAIIFLSTRRLMVDTQVTRVREEHRIITRALHNYFVDNYDFPDETQGLIALSEPVTYLASIPRDIFAGKEESGERYVYHTWRQGGLMMWLLISRGPDGDLDFDERFNWPSDEGAVVVALSNSGVPTPHHESLRSTVLLLSYDPTNGLDSSGDIITITPFAPPD
ncbi:hypothetical protein JXA47_09510 [Candidatus Sumerlaeota bacterium]|nr:hypothetical protein [Candidatus Sumerlaeota bacterium]